jgi:hypothetical protein
MWCQGGWQGPHGVTLAEGAEGEGVRWSGDQDRRALRLKMRTSVSGDKVVTNHSGKARRLQGSGCFLRTAVSAGNEYKE